MPPAVFQLGDTTIELHEGWTRTVFADGHALCARHDDCQCLGQSETATALGYDSVQALNRCHDVVHALLAVWLGLPRSPTLYGAAVGQPWPDAWMEESVVLGLQQLMVRLQIDPLALAARFA